jgi:FlaA1/EpsC-like NDP-sugar epimerase
MLKFPRYAKIGIILLVDTSLCCMATWLAYYLATSELVAFYGSVLWAAAISVALAIPLFYLSGLYRAIFRYYGFLAIFSVSYPVAMYGLMFASIVTVVGIPGIPRMIGLIQPLLLLFFISSSRVIAGYFLSGAYRNEIKTNTIPRALVYGAGSAGSQLVSGLRNSHEMRVVGFLDDDDSLHGRILIDQPIFSPSNLENLILSRGVTHVLLAVPSASRYLRNQMLKRIGGHSNISVRTLPSLIDLAEGRVTTSDLRELDIDDLLGRETITPSNNLLTKNIDSKVVLVTGAGGTIGSELCRQIINLNPKVILLLDNSEYALYSILAKLERMKEVGGSNNNEIVPLIASVQDENRILEIMDTWRPDTVYHAAAYKHVSLVEENIIEGIKNNVIGTLVTAQAALKNNVSDFVLISTDKAVRPTSVMGASKRLAELCLQGLFALDAKGSATRFTMVRFGNVLGSSGSVIPRFRRQIIDGGPITLTHLEVTRYFMTIAEAAQLVIQAGAMAKGGDVYLLNMGKPVKILDLAHSMVELSGLTVCDEKNPYGDIKIKVTGLRYGEKLHEELQLGDDPLPTAHPKIQRAQDPFVPWGDLKVGLDVLKTALSKNDAKETVHLLQKLVVGFQPSEKITDWVYVEQEKLIENKKIQEFEAKH